MSLSVSSFRELYSITSRRNLSSDASSTSSVHRSVIFFPLLEAKRRKKTRPFSQNAFRTQGRLRCTPTQCMNISADGVFRNLQATRSDFTVNRSAKVYLEPLKSHIFQQMQ